MKKTSTMKLLFFLLAALTVFSAVLLSHQYQAVRDMRKAQVASQLDHERQQIQSDDEDYQKQEDEEQLQLSNDDYRTQQAEEEKNFNEEVEALRKNIHTYAGNESKTLTDSKP